MSKHEQRKATAADEAQRARPTPAAEQPPAANGAADSRAAAAGGPESAPPVEAEAPELERVIAERDEYLEQLQRSRAEFANYRRRIEQERAQLRQQAARDLLIQLLPVLDDFQRALAAVPAEHRDSNWIAGVAMIERKLAAILERAGVIPIEALGLPFDPALHEAVAHEPGTDGNTVVEVYQPGYKLGESLLRPAMVKVGSQPAT